MIDSTIIREHLGVSPDAWEQALEVLDEHDASIIIASILQRWRWDQERWRLLAGSRESQGRGVFRLPRADGAAQGQKDLREGAEEGRLMSA